MVVTGAVSPGHHRRVRIWPEIKPALPCQLSFPFPFASPPRPRQGQSRTFFLPSSSRRQPDIRSFRVDLRLRLRSSLLAHILPCKLSALLVALVVVDSQSSEYQRYHNIHAAVLNHDLIQNRHHRIGRDWRNSSRRPVCAPHRLALPPALRRPHRRRRSRPRPHPSPRGFGRRFGRQLQALVPLRPPQELPSPRPSPGRTHRTRLLPHRRRLPGSVPPLAQRSRRRSTTGEREGSQTHQPLAPSTFVHLEGPPVGHRQPAQDPAHRVQHQVVEPALQLARDPAQPDRGEGRDRPAGEEDQGAEAERHDNQTQVGFHGRTAVTSKKDGFT